MLKVKVKVSNVNNLSDARYCAGMGVDMLGFSIGGDYSIIDPKKYEEITGWISGPKFVIEWSGAGIPDTFIETLRSYNASMVEINVHLLKKIPSLPVEWIVSLPLDVWDLHKDELRAKKHNVAYLLVTELTDPLERELISEVAAEFPVLLSNVSVDDLELISDLPIAGISLQGSSESKPGIMDYGHVDQILERLSY